MGTKASDLCLAFDPADSLTVASASLVVFERVLPDRQYVFQHREGRAKLPRPNPKARRPEVELCEATFRKYYFDPREAELERVKSQAAQKVAETYGSFLTPQVLHYDERSTTWHRLPGLRPLLHELRSGSNQGLAMRAGTILAQIHQGLRIPTYVSLVASPPLDRNLVAIHGDFSLTNVQVEVASGRLVILDWSTAPWLGTFTLGSRHVDMSILLLNLFYRRPGEEQVIPKPEMLAREFMSGYAEVSDPALRNLPLVMRHVVRRFVVGVPPYWRQTLRAPSLARLMLETSRLSRLG